MATEQHKPGQEGNNHWLDFGRPAEQQLSDQYGLHADLLGAEAIVHHYPLAREGEEDGQ